MLLIYAHTTTARLSYITAFLFNELLGIDHKITNDREEFRSYEGPKINYSDISINDTELKMMNHSLLFETGIRLQDVECFGIGYYKAFFRTGGEVFPFDIFAASFYLLSRYEEYLPHTRDEYGRYAHQNSLAYKEKFLQVPVINSWAEDLRKTLIRKFSSIKFTPKEFRFIPTYDIDIAWSFRNKGIVRNAGAFIRTPEKQRIKVLLGMEKDPFDAYDWLDGLHDQAGLTPIYFFLVAKKNSQYDKHILPANPKMKKLVQRHGGRYRIGLHPSWRSGDEPGLIRKEKEQLESMTGQPITLSRQHYIRLELPATYRLLMESGISDDYSMGYGSINGFRASVASPFYWYDLSAEEQTSLRVHPFCFMDANSYYEQGFTTAQANEEISYYFSRCREVNGEFISIWHNSFLGKASAFAGWREVYERFIAQVRSTLSPLSS